MIDRSSLKFALVCAVAATVFLVLVGCSASMQVDGIGLRGVLDPGKLGPLFRGPLPNAR